MNRRLLFALALGLVAAPACSDDASGSDAADTGTDTSGTTDAGADVAQSDAGEEDVATIGDVSGPQDTSGNDDECDPEQLIELWPLLDVADDGTGHTFGADGDGLWMLTIDASAGGGMEAARNNPFVYVDLDTPGFVDISDVDALDATGWDIAFKRTLIRINSADSGDGTVEMAKVEQAFDDVTAVPDGLDWYTDVSYDAECVPLLDPINNPLAAINYLNPLNPTGSQSWYLYGNGIEPEAGVTYLIRNTDGGGTFKFEITAWNSGVFTLRLGAL